VTFRPVLAHPPKNGVIALWPNTSVVKCKYYVSQKQMGSIIRSTRTVLNSLLYLNSRQGFNGLKHLCPVISVKMERLPGNTKNRLFTRSWTARVRLVHSWAVWLIVTFFLGDFYIHTYVYIYIVGDTPWASVCDLIVCAPCILNVPGGRSIVWWQFRVTFIYIYICIYMYVMTCSRVTWLMHVCALASGMCDKKHIQVCMCFLS